MITYALCLLLLLVTSLSAANGSIAPPLLGPDPRYKADLLVIAAHPDDDMVIGGYLARASLDQHKRIAVVYCTSGDGGGNSVGYEAGASLGQMRMMEARRALGSLGITNVWFLGGHDTPGQNLLWSLDSWNHGRALDEMVRLVRITRPEVIMTWLPNYVVGENHDDHQASGLLATEAFDMAGDPTQFPEQVSPPRNRTGMMNLTEGLLPWQPEKLYYFSDAFEDFGPYWHDPNQLSPYRKNFLDGHGPTYSVTDISPARHESYAKIAAEQQVFYATQEGDIGERALKNGSFKDFEYPVRLIFGKSVVGGSVTGDVFENVSQGPVPLARVRGHQPEPTPGLSFEIGDPWRFYRLFWKAHDLDHIAAFIPVPEVGASFGQTLHIDFRACNNTGSAAQLIIRPALPAGWTDQTKFTTYPVAPGECYPVQAILVAPPSGKAQWQQLSWTAVSGGHAVGKVDVRAYVGDSGGLPQ